MEKHLQHRTPDTPRQIDRVPPPLGPLAQPQARLLRIHDPRQSPQNARHGAGHPDGGGDHELDFDVAEDCSAEPGGEVVVGPEEGVEGGLEVEEEEPEDEGGGADVAVCEVPEHRGGNQEGGEEREG
jgi:hypothetical protein